MQAVVYPAPQSLEVRAVAEPAAGAGQALVRVRATTICATDLKIQAGLFPGTRFPHIPGHEWDPTMDPVERYLQDVAIVGTAAEVVDRFKELEATIPMNYLMLAPMSQDTFVRFTRDVLPKLV